MVQTDSNISIQLATTPLIATYNRSVQNANVSCTAAISCAFLNIPVRLIQKIRVKACSGSFSTVGFIRKSCLAPPIQTEFVDKVLYLLYDLPYECGNDKWLQHGVLKHTWMFLLCRNQQITKKYVILRTKPVE